MTENISTGTLAAAAALAYKNDPVAQNANDFSSWKKMQADNAAATGRRCMYNVLSRARRIGTRLR
jgi:hypothetical protein